MEKPVEHFVVFHKKGPSWPKQGLSFNDPIAQEHSKYFGSLHSQGLVVDGGPFPGKSGGMMVFKKDMSLEEVTKYANNDPAIKSGTLAFDIKSWLRVFKK